MESPEKKYCSCGNRIEIGQIFCRTCHDAMYSGFGIKPSYNSSGSGENFCKACDKSIAEGGTICQECAELENEAICFFIEAGVFEFEQSAKYLMEDAVDEMEAVKWGKDQLFLCNLRNRLLSATTAEEKALADAELVKAILECNILASWHNENNPILLSAKLIFLLNGLSWFLTQLRAEKDEKPRLRKEIEQKELCINRAKKALTDAWVETRTISSPEISFTIVRAMINLA